MNTMKMVKWQPWEYQLDLLRIFLTYPEIIILKARQLGISWMVVGYCLWKALCNENAKILFFSQGEDEAWDLVTKAKFIYSKLPQYLQLETKNSNRGFITWSNDSVIKALPSTEKAGKGTDTTIVVRDELFTHPNAAENFTAIGPTLDSGGQSIDLSTLESDDLTNHFRQRVDKAYDGAERVDYPSGLVLFKKGKFEPVLVFLGWKLRPTRLEGLELDEWWNSRIVPKYTAYQREKQYPATIEEALRISQSRSYFDLKALDDMRHQIMETLVTEQVPIFDGMVKVYKLPVIGERYFIFTDPSDGVEDPFHTVVMNARTYEGVCEASGKITADKVALIHDTLVRCYNNAYNSYEVTGFSGGKFSESVKDLGTPNQAPRRDLQTGKIIPDKVGWWTSEQTKGTMFSGLEEAIRTRSIISHLRETIDQFQSIVVPEGGKPQKASKSGHDDAVMAWAGVWQLRKFVPQGVARVEGGIYRG